MFGVDAFCLSFQHTIIHIIIHDRCMYIYIYIYIYIYLYIYVQVKTCLVSAGWSIHEVYSYAEDFDQTFVAWNQKFQATHHSLPGSFRRTWEFYLLHMAACYRARHLQIYQMTLIRQAQEPQEAQT